MKLTKLAFLTVLSLTQITSALAFSRHKQPTLCEAILSRDLSQAQINQKIADAGNLQGATCINSEIYDSSKIAIVFYAISQGISNVDYGSYGSASVETIENLVKAGADVNDIGGDSKNNPFSTPLYLSLNQPDLAVFLMQNGAKVTHDTFTKEVQNFGSSASIPVLMKLLAEGAGTPDLILNTLNAADDISWLAAEEAIAAQYPNAVLFDQTVAYSVMSSYGTTFLPEKLNWLIEHGLKFDIIQTGQTLTAWDYAISQANTNNMTQLSTIATDAKLTVTSSDLQIAAANAEAVFNYVLTSLPLDISVSGNTNLALATAISRGFSLATIKQLLALKPDLSIEAKTEPTTLLALAASISTVDVVNALVSAGANVSQISSITHQTAFMTAVAAGKEDNALALLTASEPLMNTINSSGQTALMLAAKLTNDNLLSIIAGLPGAHLEAADNTGRTALFYAVGAGVESSVLDLLSRGACIKVLDNTGETPLGLSNDNNPYGYNSGLKAITNDIQAYSDMPNHC